MCDVFISYKFESIDLVKKIVNVLEKNNIKCWYAPRDVGTGVYAEKIVEAINNSKIFLLVLDEKANKSKQVLNEVNIVSKVMNNTEIEIIPFKLTNDDINMSIDYYTSRFQWVDGVNVDLEKSVLILLNRIKEHLGIKLESPKKNDIRESNKYFQYQDVKELTRLKTQKSLFQNYSKHVYDCIKEEYNKPVILDLGSNDGTMTSELFELLDASLTIGLDFDKESVEMANKQYGNEKMYFYEQDLEANDLRDNLETIVKNHNVEGFDILHISMVLLHLKKPFKVLSTLHRFMKPNGKIIIRDIDDGYNVAYPDEKGYFSHAIEIIGRNQRWGYRKSGREIYTLLKKIDCSNITQEQIGINTMNMTFSEREALFHTYFGSVIYDLYILLEDDPTNEQYIADKEWIEEHIDEMQYLFYQNSFYFLLGFVLFTANIKK